MTRRGGILALDLSSHVGWAWGITGDAAPVSGVWELPSVADLGRRFAAFENELLDAFDRYQPAVVSMEAPLPASQQTHAYSAELQIGLAAITECSCYRWEKPLYRRAPGTVRAGVLGTARFPKGEAKKAVMAWCQARGWRFADHNAADALLVWAYEAGIRAARSKPAQTVPVLGRPGAVV